MLQEGVDRFMDLHPPFEGSLLVPRSVFPLVFGYMINQYWMHSDMKKQGWVD
jgi:hypothetical protein